MTRLLPTSLFLWATILMLLSAATTPVHGFASWLRCYVELETDEVVMNHYIQPSSKDAYQIPIQIQQDDGETWRTSVPSSSTASSNTSNTKTLQVRLEFPEELLRQDVQWVMEVTPEGAAEFVGHGRMCGGARAFSKNHEAVTLTIKENNENSNKASTTPIKLVAGYAAGHEAVVLTQPMLLGGGGGGGGEEEDDGTTKEL